MFNLMNKGIDSNTISLIKGDNTYLLDATKNRFDFNGVNQNGNLGHPQTFNNCLGNKTYGNNFSNLGIFMDSIPAFRTYFNANCVTAFSVQFQANIVSLANGPVLVAWNNNNNNSLDWAIRLLSSGAMRLIADDSIFTDSVAGLVTTGAWYTIGVSYDEVAQRMKGYICPFGQSTSTSICTVDTSATTLSNLTIFQVGYNYLSGSFNTNGYIQDFRVIKGVVTQFPVKN